MVTTHSAPSRTRQLIGHRPLKLGIGPFAGVAPALLLAAAWFIAAVVWGTVGSLPGGRWLVVHLVTLGVLSNLLLAFSQHFAKSVTRSSRALGQWSLPALNVAILALVGGMVAGNLAALAAGATVVLLVVGLARIRLAQMRTDTSGARFAWVVRTYERAHEALIAGAVMGAAMGAGVVPGAWYGGARLAHLHLNILGWTGLTVLATTLFFAPAMLRVRIPDGVEDRAARSVRIGAIALFAAASLLLLGDRVAGVPSVLAAVALVVYAWPVASVARSVLALARGAHPCAARHLLPAAMAWFLFAVIIDVVLLLTGYDRLLPAVGVALGVGVGLQLILAVGLYLIPSLRGRGFAARDAFIARTEQGAVLRAVLLNPAVLLLVLAAALPGGLPSALIAGAWAVVVGVVVHALALAAVPVTPDPTVARSTVAKRYRASAEAAR